MNVNPLNPFQTGFAAYPGQVGGAYGFNGPTQVSLKQFQGGPSFADLFPIMSSGDETGDSESSGSADSDPLGLPGGAGVLGASGGGFDISQVLGLMGLGSSMPAKQVHPKCHMPHHHAHQATQVGGAAGGALGGVAQVGGMDPQVMASLVQMLGLLTSLMTSMMQSAQNVKQSPKPQVLGPPLTSPSSVPAPPSTSASEVAASSS